MHPNNFYVFEGPNGSGKSTVMKNVAKKIKKEFPEKKIISTKEPGGTELGSKIRQILLKDKVDINNLSNLFLFMADRAQHYEYLKDVLNTKDLIILCDRFWESTLVYQCLELKGKKRKEMVDYIFNFHKIATENLMPTKTFVITSDNSHGFNDKDKFDKKDKKYREFANLHYKSLANSELIKYPTELHDTTNKNWEEIEEKIFKSIIK